MFRFSIRDVLLVILIVGMALGWSLDRSRLVNRLAKAELWRGRAGALEDILRADDAVVTWNFEMGEVSANWPDPGPIRSRTTEFFSPSADPKP